MQKTKPSDKKESAQLLLALLGVVDHQHIATRIPLLHKACEHFVKRDLVGNIAHSASFLRSIAFSLSIRAKRERRKLWGMSRRPGNMLTMLLSMSGHLVPKTIKLALTPSASSRKPIAQTSISAPAAQNSMEETGVAEAALDTGLRRRAHWLGVMQGRGASQQQPSVTQQNAQQSWSRATAERQSGRPLSYLALEYIRQRPERSRGWHTAMSSPVKEVLHGT